MYTRFHPNTINVIKQYEHGNQDAGFDLFTQGKEMWKTEQFQDDFADKIRNFVEECDSLQVRFYYLINLI